MRNLANVVAFGALFRHPAGSITFIARPPQQKSASCEIHDQPTHQQVTMKSTNVSLRLFSSCSQAGKGAASVSCEVVLSRNSKVKVCLSVLSGPRGAHTQRWREARPHLSDHAVPRPVHLLAVFAVCNQVEVVRELHRLGDFLQDVDAETFAAAFDVDPRITCLVAERWNRRKHNRTSNFVWLDSVCFQRV